MQNQDNSFIQHQAHDWLVKLETGAMNDGDEDRFVAWLEQDERHGQAFYEAEQAWHLMHQASDAFERADVEQTSNEQRRTTPTKEKPVWGRVHRFILPLAATVLLSVITLLQANHIWLSLTADHYTATGERTEQRLSDGSVITLNTDSAIDVIIDEQSRRVMVLQGEIYVDVASDKSKPFIVTAGNMQVTALGTEFIVRHESGEEPRVIVTEHSVKVENTAKPIADVIIGEGQKVSLAQNGQISPVAEVNQQHASAWLKGKLVFKNQPLEQVVTELSRYYKGKMIITDDGLKQRRVSGVLNLDNPVTSLQTMAQALSVNVSQITPYLTLIESR